MKYRRNKVKREHGIIEDALQWFEELASHQEVNDIIPGVIEVTRSPEKGITYKYETQTGCKLLVKSNGSIQEAFVVTQNPFWVKRWVESHFPTINPSSRKDKGIKKENSLRKENKAQDKDLTRQRNQDRYFDVENEVKDSWIQDIIRARRGVIKKKKPKLNKSKKYDERGFVEIDKNLKNTVLQQWVDENNPNLEAVVNPNVVDALQKLKFELEHANKKKPSNPNSHRLNK